MLRRGEATALAVGAVTFAAASVAPIALTSVDLGLQLVYLSSLVLAGLLFAVMTVASAMHIRRRRGGGLDHDRIAAATARPLFVLLVSSLLCGTLWVYSQVDRWWTWSTPLTVCGLAVLAQTGYFAVRRFDDGARRRADRAAVVALAAALQLPFAAVAVWMWSPSASGGVDPLPNALTFDQPIEASWLIGCGTGLAVVAWVSVRVLDRRLTAEGEARSRALERALVARRTERD